MIFFTWNLMNLLRAREISSFKFMLLYQWRCLVSYSPFLSSSSRLVLWSKWVEIALTSNITRHLQKIDFTQSHVLELRLKGISKTLLKWNKGPEIIQCIFTFPHFFWRLINNLNVKAIQLSYHMLKRRSFRRGRCTLYKYLFTTDVPAVGRVFTLMKTIS